jgi:hypothetical protein
MAKSRVIRAQVDVESLRAKVEDLICNFKSDLLTGDIRSKVLALIPVFKALRNVGKALIPSKDTPAAIDRIIFYFRKYSRTVISGDEFLVVSGIQDYPRRIRELKVQLGWAIASGVTIKEMCKDDPEEIPSDLIGMKTSQYILLRDNQDRDAAHRWHVANSIRKKKSVSVQNKILEFLRMNVGKGVTNEELRYVAGNSTEWARRVRELRTEQGWPIMTKTTGQKELDIGVYVLQADRQSPVHDRVIPDAVRRKVMRRDGCKCSSCGWAPAEWNSSDPRNLEIHHVKAHAMGGTNDEVNLITLCTSCHDVIHQHKA